RRCRPPWTERTRRSLSTAAGRHARAGVPLRRQLCERLVPEWDGRRRSQWRLEAGYCGDQLKLLPSADRAATGQRSAAAASSASASADAAAPCLPAGGQPAPPDWHRRSVPLVLLRPTSERL